MTTHEAVKAGVVIRGPEKCILTDLKDALRRGDKFFIIKVGNHE